MFLLRAHLCRKCNARMHTQKYSSFFFNEVEFCLYISRTPNKYSRKHTQIIRRILKILFLKKICKFRYMVAVMDNKSFHVNSNKSRNLPNLLKRYTVCCYPKPHMTESFSTPRFSFQKDHLSH
jgi:hypothetical protein